MGEEESLTVRQERAILAILSTRSLEEARRCVQAAKGTFYKWLKEPAFQAALTRKRKELVTDAFEKLKDGWVVTQAVNELLELMQDKAGDDGVRLRAAKTLLERGLSVRTIVGDPEGSRAS